MCIAWKCDILMPRRTRKSKPKSYSVNGRWNTKWRDCVAKHKKATLRYLWSDCLPVCVLTLFHSLIELGTCSTLRAGVMNIMSGSLQSTLTAGHWVRQWQAKRNWSNVSKMVQVKHDYKTCDKKANWIYSLGPSWFLTNARNPKILAIGKVGKRWNKIHSSGLAHSWCSSVNLLVWSD